MRRRVMTAPRPMGTSADPPRGRVRTWIVQWTIHAYERPAWERPGARPATKRLTQDVSCVLGHGHRVAAIPVQRDVVADRMRRIAGGSRVAKHERLAAHGRCDI